jgi:hypothetical protein
MLTSSTKLSPTKTWSAIRQRAVEGGRGGRVVLVTVGEWGRREGWIHGWMDGKDCKGLGKRKRARKE